MAIVITGKDLAGIATSWTQNKLDKTTQACVEHSAIDVTDDVHVSATNGDDDDKTYEIFAISAGRRRASGYGIAGSVSINRVFNTAQAYIRNDTNIASARNVTIEAVEGANIFAVAGSLSYGGKAGAGLSFAWNEINNDWQEGDSGTRALVEDADVNATGSVLVVATTTSSIFSVAAAIGLAKSSDKLAAAAAVTVDTVSNTTSAAIRRKRTWQGIRADGGVSVEADDDSDVFTVAGNLSGGADLGFGVSIAINVVHNQTTASIEDTVVDSDVGDVTVKSSATTDIVSIAAGGSQAGNCAGRVIFRERRLEYRRPTLAAGQLPSKLMATSWSRQTTT